MALPAFRVLSLCTGIGGLDIGLRMACPSARTVCYVEREGYCAEVLAERMEEGRLDDAPIWSDLRTFDGKPWRGAVDCVVAGYPCQPFSQAGKRLGEQDPRHLWPEVARIIDECGPAAVFLENVMGHVRKGLSVVRADLQRMGYCVAPPRIAAAAELGAGHIRRRVFVLAYRNGFGLQLQCGTGQAWAAQREGPPLPPGTSAEGVLADADALEPRAWGGERGSRRRDSVGDGGGWWAAEPGVARVVHGLPNRVDRERALGNAVVPAQAALAFRELVKRASA